MIRRRWVWPTTHASSAPPSGASTRQCRSFCISVNREDAYPCWVAQTSVVSSDVGLADELVGDRS